MEMDSMESKAAAKIEYHVFIGLRGPIAEAEYNIGAAVINVSYPIKTSIGGVVINLPVNTSTLFRVWWFDDEVAQKLLKLQSYEKNLIIHTALSFISELLTAYKLVKIGHGDGFHVRTVGISDTLMYTVFVGERQLEVNAAILFNYVANASEATKLARPHIATGTYAIARRYVRCFELIEIGFYKESFIVSHAILGDLVQEMINKFLKVKGLSTDQSRKTLTRAIKEDRLSIYLGPLLKVIGGVSIEEIWGHAPQAIAWLNSVRNKIAHGGSEGDRNSACKAVFVSMKAVAALDNRNFIDAKFPPGMRRHSRLLASWTPDRPIWVPEPNNIEIDEFE
jgi:hypothetical protein